MSSKTHVYHITSYYPPHVGGLEFFVQRIAESISKYEFDVSVITSDIGSNPGRQREQNLTINRLRSKEILSTPLLSRLYQVLFDAPSNSIFHIHVAQAVLPEISYLVAKKKKIPIVTHIHLDVGSSSLVGKFVLPFYKWLFLSRVLKGSTKIIVQSNGYKALLQEKYKIADEKFLVIPNGISLLPENTLKYADIHEPFTILSVGRLVTQKRIDILVDAIALLVKKRIGVQVTIIGDGPLLSALSEQTRNLGLENVISFLGERSQNEVSKYFSLSDCLVQTSERESFSTVLLEALNHGCPIIASDIPGTRDFLSSGDDSLLVRLEPQEVANAIELLMNNNQLRKGLIKTGYETVKKYDWQSIVGKIETLYSELK